MNMIALLLLTLASTVLVPGKERQKIIVDCDFGGDIDDAFAVALILSSPEFEVLGLVMDHGNTPLRARTALKFLFEIGREDIPIVVGKATPNMVGVDTSTAGYSHQFWWSEGFDKRRASTLDAADFIITTLRRYPNEVVLITLGPLCNIKQVIKKDKEALKLARKVVSMFGSFYMGYDVGTVRDKEWNVRADIEASQMFASSGANVMFVGLDVTTFVKLNAENRNRLLMRQSPLTNAMCGLYSLWLYESFAQPDANLFDVVTVGAVLWPDLFTNKKTNVRVDDEGYTLMDDTKTPNCEIVVSIKKDEFLRRIMERYLRQNLQRN
jgi:purine nucleosidase